MRKQGQQGYGEGAFSYIGMNGLIFFPGEGIDGLERGRQAGGHWVLCNRNEILHFFFSRIRQRGGKGGRQPRWEMVLCDIGGSADGMGTSGRCRCDGDIRYDHSRHHTVTSFFFCEFLLKDVRL